MTCMFLLDLLHRAFINFFVVDCYFISKSHQIYDLWYKHIMIYKRALFLHLVYN